MAEKSSFGIRQTDGKNLVWFGEIERKLAKVSIPTVTYISSSKLFYEENRTGLHDSLLDTPNSWGGWFM